MFTQLESREVETEGVLQSNAFTIKANGKAFKVLIDGLYSDKVRSIVRELWSNAFDSHVAAGKPDVPFDCQLPTMWEPVFRVRDYGVSLHHEDVMHLYTTVFESTKENNNSQVGKLGLGSKSPFAYTDTFTVTTWRDGMKRVYSAYIGTDHVPMISLLGIEESDEPQGLEVAFPVHADDIYTFKTAANRVAAGFSVLPNTFDYKLELPIDEVLYEGVGWKLYASSGSIGAQAKQGCVIYPIDANMVVGATSEQRDFLRAPFFIEFPIGDLEIAASREGLGYTPETCRNIIAAIDRISADIYQQLAQEFSTFKTYWEACRFYASRQTSSLPKPVLKILEGMEFRGRFLHTKWYVNDPQIRHIDSEVARGIRKRNSGGWEGKSSCYVRPLDMVVYFQDATKKTTRIKDRLKHAYQNSSAYADRKDILVVRGVPGSMEVKRLWITLGRPPIEARVEDLPLPPKAASAPRKRVSVKEFIRNNYTWGSVDIDVYGGGLYVPLERFIAQRPVGDTFEAVANHQVRDAVDALEALGFVPKDVTVYGIPMTLRHLSKRSPHWKCLWDVVTDALTIGFNRPAIERYNILQYSLSQFHERQIGQLCKRWMRMCIVPTGAAFDLLTKYSALAAELEAMKGMEHYLTLSQLFGGYEIAALPEDIPADLDLAPGAEVVLDKYPLLSDVLRSGVNDDIAKRLSDYVSLIDSRVISTDTTAIEEAA
jgi:hypothetical protein